MVSPSGTVIEAEKAILQKQEKLEVMHAHFSPKLGARLSRYVAFSQGKIVLVTQLACESLKGAAIGGVAGAVGGAALGGLPGAATGAKIGAVVGAVVKPVVALIELERSDKFRIWLEQAIHRDLEAFKEFCEEDDDMRDLLCMITGEWPREPVIAPDGKVYDRRAIEEWVGGHPENASPIRGVNFTIADLVPYPTQFRLIIMQINKIYREKISRMKADDIRREGFEALKESLLKDCSAATAAKFKEVLNQFLKGSISREEFDKLTNLIIRENMEEREGERKEEYKEERKA